jgi:hypothetical protein
MTVVACAGKLLEPTGTNSMFLASVLVLTVVLIKVLLENLFPIGLATVRVRRK